MPSLDLYKKMLGSQTSGRSKKNQSDIIMEASWYEDISTQTAYFYDYYMDDQPLEYKNMKPMQSKTKIPIDIKFIVSSHNSDSKDQVSYKIQFKPSFRWEEIHKFSFYKERFADKFDAEYPVGLYVDIADEKGNYRKWLVTAEADWLDNQFPTWYILPCDFCFKWVFENTLYQMVGVSRSQNSYNSGRWESRGGAVQTAVPENQKICLLPMNDISSTIFYDQRISISQPLPTPITWNVSKAENKNPNGINTFTFAQSRWNEHTDAFEYLNEDGTKEFSSVYETSRRIIGMWCDYYSSSIIPEEPKPIPPTQKIYSVIEYSGLKPEIKSGGSYKKVTVNFYEPNGMKSDFQDGRWYYTIDGDDAENLLTILTKNTSNDVEENQIKIKFNKDDTYIGKVLKVGYVSTYSIESFVEFEILGL